MIFQKTIIPCANVTSGLTEYRLTHYACCTVKCPIRVKTLYRAITLLCFDLSMIVLSFLQHWNLIQMSAKFRENRMEDFSFISMLQSEIVQDLPVTS